MIFVALYRGTAPISRAIEWFTRSAYSHAEFWFMPGNEVLRAAGVPEHGCIISAERHGVVMQNIPIGIWENTSSGRLAIDLLEWDNPLLNKQEVEIWNAAKSMVGWKYDYSDILFSFPLHKRQEFKAKRRKVFCSEVVLESVDQANRNGAKIQPILVRYRPWKEPPESINKSPTLSFARTVFAR